MFYVLLLVLRNFHISRGDMVLSTAVSMSRPRYTGTGAGKGAVAGVKTTCANAKLIDLPLHVISHHCA